MASILLKPVLRPLPLSYCVGISFAILHFGRQRPLQLDAGPISSTDGHKRIPQTPILQNGRLNPKAVRQISSGSILGTPVSIRVSWLWANISAGLCAGLAVSTFSRSLALLIGLLLVGMQVTLPSLFDTYLTCQWVLN